MKKLLIGLLLISISLNVYSQIVVNRDISNEQIESLIVNYFDAELYEKVPMDAYTMRSYIVPSKYSIQEIREYINAMEHKFKKLKFASYWKPYGDDGGRICLIKNNSLFETNEVLSIAYVEIDNMFPMIFIGY